MKNRDLGQDSGVPNVFSNVVDGDAWLDQNGTHPLLALFSMCSLCTLVSDTVGKPEQY